MDKDAVGATVGAAGFIPLAGDAAKLPKQLDNIADALKLANKVASSPFSAKLDRVSEHLQMKDLTAAARELKGEVVARKADGTPWDHVHEVRDAQWTLSPFLVATSSGLGEEALSDEASEAAAGD
ncbi:polymorphic toxin type 28 domain-containing protein, partial [Streptomyces sp. NPDC051677]|uniref:polymorphic toxin type 28 domain-containing protein n=1 Tax=Streptomyces sp. NPDC051677 TaxID=3365669 RepID=UPI0037D16FD4